MLSHNNCCYELVGVMYCLIKEIERQVLKYKRLGDIKVGKLIKMTTSATAMELYQF